MDILSFLLADPNVSPDLKRVLDTKPFGHNCTITPADEQESRNRRMRAQLDDMGMRAPEPGDLTGGETDK